MACIDHGYKGDRRAEYLPPIKGVRVSNQKELSLKYGVSIPQVSHIVNHKGRNLPAREV